MDHSLLSSSFQVDVEAIDRIAAIPTILDTVCRITGMGFAAVARVTEDRWVACCVQDQLEFGLRPGGELAVETTICHEIRQHRRPVIIDNVAKDAIYCTHRTPAMYGFQSYISLPITLPDGSLFGTLCAIDPKPRTLNTPEVLGTFTLFAQLIAFHLEANRQVAATEARLSQEREASELREHFIAVLGHDLRNPLASVKAGTKLLLRHPDRAVEIAGHIEQSISRMAGLIDNVLDFARGRLGGGLTLAPTAGRPLEPTLVQVIQELRSIHQDRIIDVDIVLEQPVCCDHQRIAQLFSNLLGNALTHGAKTRPVHVNARANGGIFTLSVANAGEPIPPAVLQNLFQPFFRGGIRESQDGLGLGLFIASQIARAHEGEIGVTSAPAETRFTFRMPAGTQSFIET